MPKPVIWSTQADKDLERILDYLAQEWENSVSAKFLDLVDFLLKQLRDQCMRRRMRWVLDADIQGCFDNFDHGILRELLTRRIKDKNIMRLINQWLRTGVVDGKSMQRNTKGTPQGNIISHRKYFKTKQGFKNRIFAL